MIAETAKHDVPLEAKSPFELRVDLSKNVAESVIKQALETGETGFLHSFTTGSTVDGPGVRLVAWTAGCHFKCIYCHNPDTWNMMNGIPVPLERAVDELAKYRHGLKIMGGGFTLSGGEPLRQDRFAARLFASAKEMGIHTAVDTNGSMGAKLSDNELKNIDLVMLCIKSLDPQQHLELTGKELGPTLEFARRVADLNRPMWLRYVLVPGFTDSDEYIEQMAQFMVELGNCERVDMMPFHQLGRYKWEKLGIEYKLADIGSPSSEAVDIACQHFRAAGLQAF